MGSLEQQAFISFLLRLEDELLEELCGLLTYHVSLSVELIHHQTTNYLYLRVY
jgi:hypothetical protein